MKKLIDSLELYQQSRWVDLYDALSPSFPDQKIVYRAVAPFLEPDVKTMLDVGIGTGLSSEPFVDHGIEVTGVDGSDAMLDKLAKKSIASKQFRTDFEESSLPFDDGAFPLVISHATLYLISDSDLVMNEMIRVTKPGGLVAFNYEVSEDFCSRENDATHTRGQSQAVPTYSLPEDHVSLLFNNRGMKRLSSKTEAVFEKMDGRKIFFETLVYRKPFSL